MWGKYTLMDTSHGVFLHQSIHCSGKSDRGYTGSKCYDWAYGDTFSHTLHILHKVGYLWSDVHQFERTLYIHPLLIHKIAVLKNGNLAEEIKHLKSGCKVGRKTYRFMWLFLFCMLQMHTGTFIWVQAWHTHGHNNTRLMIFLVLNGKHPLCRDTCWSFKQRWQCLVWFNV
jgi:hypothetical protein